MAALAALAALAVLFLSELVEEREKALLVMVGTEVQADSVEMAVLAVEVQEEIL